MKTDPTDLAASTALMSVVGLLLLAAPGMMPGVHGVVGGVAGGFHARRPRQAYLAAALSAGTVALTVWVLYFCPTVYNHGLFYGFHPAAWAALHTVGLFIGAWVGGRTVCQDGPRHAPAP